VEPAEAVAFDAFVVSRGPALVRFAHALSGDAFLAEDLVQEVLVKAHRRWDRLDAPEAYLRTALCRELISWRRRRSSTERPGELPEREAQDAGEQLAERDLIWRLLATLPRRQRVVLVLRYWEGLPDREIAALLDLSEGSVRSLASRAFTLLRAHPQLAHLTVPTGATP
jgi:RNA polymerase sigma-70 factor (sigma-E family)